MTALTADQIAKIDKLIGHADAAADCFEAIAQHDRKIASVWRRVKAAGRVTNADRAEMRALMNDDEETAKAKAEARIAHGWATAASRVLN